MVFGPFGIDAFALTNILSVVKELNDRSHATAEIHTFASYLIQRANRLEPHMHDSDPDARQPSPTAPLSSNRILAQHSLLIPDPANRSLSSLVQHTLRMFVRRDFHFEILRTVARYQTHEVQDRVLHIATHIAKDVRSIILNNELAKYARNCLNTKGAATLQRDPRIRLLGLDSAQDRVSDPLHKPHPTLAFIPTWGVCPPSPPLLAARHHLSNRLHVLCDVAAAFARAHAVHWYHGRLTSHMIRIVEPRAHPLFRHTRPIPYAVVLHFVDRRNQIGCRACEHCYSTENDAPREHPAAHHPPHPAPLSFRHCPHPAPDAADSCPHPADARDAPAALQPELDDLYIFGNLVCWLYSGQCFDYNDRHSQRNAHLLQHVPWPLRMIVAHAPNVPMSDIHQWLTQLRDRSIDPYADRPLYPLPSTFVSNSSPIARVKNAGQAGEPCKSKSEAMFECAVLAATVAAKECEPQAVLHLGLLFELLFRRISHQLSPREPRAVSALEGAYDCYAVAIQLGNASALRHMARVLSLAQDDAPLARVPRLSQSQILSLLLEGAVLRSAGACGTLRVACAYGVRTALRESFPGAGAPGGGGDDGDDGGGGGGDDGDDGGGGGGGAPFCDADVMQVLFDVASRLRLGEIDFAVDLKLAVGCLFHARRLGHLGAALELGLLLVQRATNADQVRQGIDILQTLANWPLAGEKACAQSLEACFRIGRWYLSKFPHEFELEEFPNRKRAARYLKSAASQNHKTAMVQFGMMQAPKSPLGNSGRDQDVNHWISNAKDHPSAFEARGVLGEIMIDQIWNNKKHESASISIPSAGSASSGANLGLQQSECNKKEEEQKQSRNRKCWLFQKRDAKPKNASKQPNLKNGALKDLPTQDGMQQKVRKETLDRLRLAEDMFQKAQEPHELYPEERYNPRPLLRAAQFYIVVKHIWPECDPSVSEADLQNQAEGLLRKVIAMTSTGAKSIEWKRSRKNWILEDRLVACKAKELLYPPSHDSD